MINGGNREKMPRTIIIIVVAIVGKAITVYGAMNHEPMQNEAKSNIFCYIKVERPITLWEAIEKISRLLSQYWKY